MLSSCKIVGEGDACFGVQRRGFFLLVPGADMFLGGYGGRSGGEVSDVVRHLQFKYHFLGVLISSCRWLKCTLEDLICRMSVGKVSKEFGVWWLHE